MEDKIFQYETFINTNAQWIEIKQTWRAAHAHINMEFIVGGCHNTRPLGTVDAPVKAKKRHPTK